MKIAGDFCVYTNHNINIERLSPKITSTDTTEKKESVSI